MGPMVLAECRPNLRACYFFIKDVVTAGPLSVEVDEQRISIRMPEKELLLNLPPALTLVPGSISGLTSTNCNLTFRTSIQEFSPTANLPNKSSVLSLKIDNDESISLHCDFCSEVLTEARLYSRVLPLPSSEEPNDFFCHRHSDEPLSLDPKPADFFYNYFFFKIHVENFKSFPTSSTLKCPKCLELLGEVQGKCVKLWNSVVSFMPIENQEGSSIDKFLKSFACFVKNLPVQMNKFVLTSSHGSSKHYTLIWIMDRTLIILENHEKSGRDSSDKCGVHLEYKKVIKVLYSHHEHLTKTGEDWMKSFNTSLIPIHSSISSRLVKYLEAAADRVPADCATVDGMSVSYIDS